MATQLSDILLWIESPAHFERGIGKLNTTDQIGSMKTLLSTILDASSKRWGEMHTDQLEKTIRSLRNIQIKCRKLYDKYFENYESYESGRYEVIIPHEWEALPPKDGNPEVIEKAIAAYYKQQKQSIERTKANLTEIIFIARGYADIAYRWSEETSRFIEQLIRTIDVKNVGEPISKDVDTGQESVNRLKPIDADALYDGITNLRNGLQRLGLISKETGIVELRKLFGLVKGHVLIPWTGGKVALRHFIFQLEEQGKIAKFKKGSKKETISTLFYLVDDPDYDLTKLSENNGPYANMDDLVQIVSDL